MIVYKKTYVQKHHTFFGPVKIIGNPFHVAEQSDNQNNAPVSESWYGYYEHTKISYTALGNQWTKVANLDGSEITQPYYIVSKAYQRSDMVFVSYLVVTDLSHGRDQAIFATTTGLPSFFYQNDANYTLDNGTVAHLLVDPNPSSSEIEEPGQSVSTDPVIITDVSKAIEFTDRRNKRFFLSEDEGSLFRRIDKNGNPLDGFSNNAIGETLESEYLEILQTGLHAYRPEFEFVMPWVFKGTAGYGYGFF